VQIPDLVSIRY